MCAHAQCLSTHTCAAGPHTQGTCTDTHGNMCVCTRTMPARTRMYSRPTHSGHSHRHMRVQTHLWAQAQGTRGLSLGPARVRKLGHRGGPRWHGDQEARCVWEEQGAGKAQQAYSRSPGYGGCPGRVHSSFHHPPPLHSFVSLIPRWSLEKEAGSWGFLLSLSASSALFSPQALF